MFNKQQLCDIEARLGKLELAALSSDDSELRAAHDSLDEDLSQLRTLFEDRLKRLTIAVADGIEHIDRKEKRIDATVGRARAQLAEHDLTSPGLDAEASEIQLVDGAGSEEQGVPAVREEVAGLAEAPSSVPGVTRAQLRAIRGM